MSEYKKDVCYIILTYNNYKEAEVTIKSVYEQSNKDLYDIIVVDNKSDHENKTKLEQLLSRLSIKYIYRDVNDGYAGGNNFAWKKYRNQYKYLFFINDDVLLKSKSLTSIMYKIMENHPELGILGPEVFWGENHKIKKNTRQKLFFDKGIFNHRFRTFGTYQEIDSLIGCFLAVRTSMKEIDDLFNESLFMYSEEFDLCVRVWAANYRVGKIIDDQYSIYHMGGQSPTSEVVFWKEYLCERNDVIVSQNFSGLDRIKFFVFINLSFIKKILSRRSFEYKKAVINGYINGHKFLKYKRGDEQIRKDAIKSLKIYKEDRENEKYGA